MSCTHRHTRMSSSVAAGCSHTGSHRPAAAALRPMRQLVAPAGQVVPQARGQEQQQWRVAGRGTAAARRVLRHKAAAVEEAEAAAPPVVQAVDGGVFIEEVSFEGGSYTVRGRLESAAPPELVYATLTDYASLSRVFHNVVDSEVLMVGQEKHLVQTCKWAFLIFSGTFRTSLAVSEDAAARRLAFHLVQSSFMRQFVGRWEVLPVPDSGSNGSSGGEGPAVSSSSGGKAPPARSLVMHSLSVEPAVAPPAAVAHYTSKIFVKQVENILKDLHAELQRRLEQEQKQH